MYPKASKVGQWSHQDSLTMRLGHSLKVSLGNGKSHTGDEYNLFHMEIIDNLQN